MIRFLTIFVVSGLIWISGGSALASPILRAEVNLPGQKAAEVKPDGNLQLSPLEPEGKDSRILTGPAEALTVGEPTLTIHRYYASGFTDVVEYFPAQAGAPGRFRIRYTGKDPAPGWAANGWYGASADGERWVSEVLARYGKNTQSNFPTLPAAMAASAGGVALVLAALRRRRARG